MIILPIRQISTQDDNLVGSKLVNLAKLARAGVSVLDGFVILPSEVLDLKFIIKNLPEDLDQKIKLLRKRILLTLIPKEVEQYLKQNNNFFYQEKCFKDVKKLWQEILFSWSEDIIKVAARGQDFSQILKNINLKPIFFLKGKPKLIRSYFHKSTEEVLILSEGVLDSKIQQKISQEVFNADQNLFIHHIYHFVQINQEIFIVDISPFTEHIPTSQKIDISSESKQNTKISRLPTATKIFLDKYFEDEKNPVSGYLIKGEDINGFENTSKLLSELGSKYPERLILFSLEKNFSSYQLPKLNHSQSLIQESLKSFLFVRRKKSLINISLVLPTVRSVEEFLEIKRLLASFGISRKGSLQIWLDVAFPENIIHIKKYLEAGLDGVILNLDLLEKNLLGISEKEKDVIKVNSDVLADFLKSYLKDIHQAKVLIMVKGELINKSEIAEFLVENGIFAVIAKNEFEVEHLWDLLKFIEEKVILGRKILT